MKKSLLICAAISAFILWHSPARAQEELAPGYDACANKAISTVDQRECLGKAYEYWDKILNSNYKQAIKACADNEHPDACKSSLVKAQKLWIQYKEAMAGAIMAMGGGGTLDAVMADSFAAEETKKQAKLLEPEN